MRPMPGVALRFVQILEDHSRRDSAEHQYTALGPAVVIPACLVFQHIYKRGGTEKQIIANEYCYWCVG